MSETYISTRSKKILYMIIAAEDYIPLSQIQEELTLSKRSVYYELCKINDWLSANGFPEIEMMRGRGIYLTQEQKEQIEKVIDGGNDKANYIFSPMERIYFIICYIIRSEKNVSVEQLEALLNVSRNTIFNDLQVVIKQLKNYDLTLEYESKKGYRIKGDSIQARALFIFYFNMLRPIYESGAADHVFKEENKTYLKRLEEIERRLSTSYVEGTLLALSELLPLMIKNDSNLYFPNLKLEEIKQQQEFRLIKEYFPELGEKEKIYLCLHLLGSRTTGKAVDVFETVSSQTNYELAKALIAEFERVACIIFSEKEELEEALFLHLNASMYRFHYGIQIGNPLLEDILREYPNLFEITRKVSFYLEQQTGFPISNDEVAYLTLHFGSHLKKGNNDTKKVRVLIVSSNGISAGNMIRHELVFLLPGVEIVGVISNKEAIHVEKLCDIVISTIRLNCSVPVIVVHPILTDFDRKIIVNHSLFRRKKGEVDISLLYEKICRFVKKEDRDPLKEALLEFFSDNSLDVIPQLDKTKKGLTSYLTPEKIKIQREPCTWMKAIRITGQCLIERESIEPRYINHIIDQLHYYGPYMFITKNVVLAHAKPEDGVLALDISMSLFSEPVSFSEFHSANVILVMAAEDQEKHLKILKDIMTVFSEKTNIEKLLTLKDPESVCCYLKERI